MKKLISVISLVAGIAAGIGGCSALVDQVADELLSEHAPAAPVGTTVGPTEIPVETPAPVETETSIPEEASDHVHKLHSLTIAEPVDNGDYWRTEQFGRAWLDLDNDDCNEREEVLARDLVDIEYYYVDGWCTIGWGTLHDPYTGETIYFEKGEDTSGLVQIDHIVPLKYAWVHGANEWTQEKRIALANDLDNLLAVKGSTNSAKGARGPAEWQPVESHWCEYSQDFIDIAHEYEVSVSQADFSKLNEMLGTCDA